MGGAARKGSTDSGGIERDVDFRCRLGEVCRVGFDLAIA